MKTQKIPGVKFHQTNPKTPQTRNDKKTFTKYTMKIVYCLYVIGAIVAIGMVLWSALWNVHLGLQIDATMLSVLATYLGAPTAVAIGFYAWKSKAENIPKIAAEIERQKLENDSIVSTLANMGGNY